LGKSRREYMYTGKKVLIVDDSAVERHILKEIISNLGFNIIEAENGETGVKMAIEHRPDLILMDVVMPGINGFQATHQITTNDLLKNVPVIMCTSKSQETDKIWGTRKGAKAYVTKPVNKEILLTEISKLLA
jgi:twitching motility two-component system response regulator PilH